MLESFNKFYEEVNEMLDRILYGDNTELQTTIMTRMNLHNKRKNTEDKIKTALISIFFIIVIIVSLYLFSKYG